MGKRKIYSSSSTVPIFANIGIAMQFWYLISEVEFLEDAIAGKCL